MSNKLIALDRANPIPIRLVDNGGGTTYSLAVTKALPSVGPHSVIQLRGSGVPIRVYANGDGTYSVGVSQHA